MWWKQNYILRNIIHEMMHTLDGISSRFITSKLERNKLQLVNEMTIIALFWV